MKKTILILAVAFCYQILSIAQSTNEAPKIIKTVPAMGDCDVDPELKEILVYFDQDMGGGMSTINTSNMPKSNGRARWVDNRTFSIPVQLYANKMYAIGFNNQKYTGFRNTSGIPLNPDMLFFKTQSVNYVQLNKKAYQELIDIFPCKYSYATRNGIEWESILKEKKEELINAESNVDFTIQLLSIFKMAEDPHLWVEFEGNRYNTNPLKMVSANCNKKLIFGMLQNKKLSKDFKVITGTIDSMAYIYFQDWNTPLDQIKLQAWGNSKNPQISLDEVLKELFLYPNLIIDVRENGGGNERNAKAIASCLIENEVAFEKVVGYNSESGKFDQEHIKTIEPNNGSLHYKGKTYVLSGPSGMSSNEAFVLMMKAAPNIDVIGMSTYGSSGNPQPYTLSNGITLYIPSWQAYTLDDELIEGNGVKPNIEIITKPEDFKDRDVLIEKVKELVSN